MSYKLEQQVAALISTTTGLINEVVDQKNRHAEIAAESSAHADRAEAAADGMLYEKVATKDELGVVKVGDGLFISEEGTINVIPQKNFFLKDFGIKPSEGNPLDAGLLLHECSTGVALDAIGFAGGSYNEGTKTFYIQDNHTGVMPKLQADILSTDFGKWYSEGGKFVFEIRKPTELANSGDSMGRFYINVPLSMGMTGGDRASCYFAIAEDGGRYRVGAGNFTVGGGNMTVNVDVSADQHLCIELERKANAPAGTVDYRILRVNAEGYPYIVYERKDAVMSNAWYPDSGELQGIVWSSGTVAGTGVSVDVKKAVMEISEVPTGGGGDGGGDSNITVVQPEDDMLELIDLGVRNIALVAGKRYVWDNIELPADFVINGNGAIVSPSGMNPCLILNELVYTGGCTVTNVVFEGQLANPCNTAIVIEHVGIRMTRSYRNKIQDCTFRNWRGAGITVQGSNLDNVYRQGNVIKGNMFEACFCGVSCTDRSEYSQVCNNNFIVCRVGVIITGGNWTVNDNLFSTCMCCYFTIAKSTPWGSLASNHNWGHGTFIGNVCNHSNKGGGSDRWVNNANIPCGEPGSGVLDLAYNPQGFAVYSINILPPTISGLTSYYSSIQIDDHGFALFSISGCVLSSCFVSTNMPGTVKLNGCSAHAKVTLTGIDKNTDCYPPMP